MLGERDVIRLGFNAEQITLAKKYAKNAEIGGGSSVRSADRKTELSFDQFKGQIGNMALSLYLSGTLEGYIASREKADKNPTLGDDGSDYPNLLWDVKTSGVKRGSRRRMGDYRLCVRPAEIHPETTYVLALLEYLRDDWTFAQVALVGCMTTEQLPEKPWGGDFGSARGDWARNLYPLNYKRWLTPEWEEATGSVIINHEGRSHALAS